MDIDYKAMGKRIASRRKALDMKQEKLAFLTGLSSKYISSIENAHSIPSIEALINLCIALKVTPDYFLMGVVKNNVDGISENIQQRISTCTTDQQKLILKLIEAVIEY